MRSLGAENISAYSVLTEHVRELLSNPDSDKTTLKQEVASDVSVQWCWESAMKGQLIVDSPSPRALNAATLCHLASIALPSALRYPAIVIPDQRRQRLRFVHSNLDADVDSVMQALETLFNQSEVLITLLIDGPIRTSSRLL